MNRDQKPSRFKKGTKLLKEHFDHLTASGISLEVINERGYESIGYKARLKALGFSPAQQRCDGILIPIHGVDREVVGYQYRPDRPRVDSRGRPVKYENPPGASVRLDVPPRCQPQLGDPGTELWITEGSKKCDALATAGACAIGLTGVWGFKGKNPLGGTTILADFDYVTFKGRAVYLVFDSDTRTNPMVRMALDRLREHLRRKGADVHTIQLPPPSDGQENRHG